MSYTRACMFLAFGVLLTSCVRDPLDIPPNLQSSPVFFADLHLGQQLTRFSAGEAGYQLHPQHFIDPEGVTRYLATFSSVDCGLQHCPRLELEFYDNQVFSHPQSGVYQTFQAGVKEYYSMSEDGLLDITFYLIQTSGGAGQSYWTTSKDSIQQTGTELELQARPDDVIDLCFHRAGIAECDGDASYCFRTRAAKPFIGVLNVTTTASDSIRVGLDLQGTPPFLYTWMSGASSPAIMLPPDSDEVRIEVVVTDATQSTIEIQHTLKIENGIAEICGGSPQFVYSIAKAPFTQFSTAVVRYVDDNGIMYSTAYGPQQGEQMDIQSISTYKDTPEGYKCKTIELALSGNLYSADGSQTLTINPSQMVIAVSYDK